VNKKHPGNQAITKDQLFSKYSCESLHGKEIIGVIPRR